MGKQQKQRQILFCWAPKSLQMVTAVMKLKDNWLLGRKAMNILFIHSSVDGHLGCFQVLPIVNSASLNTEHLSKEARIHNEEKKASSISGAGKSGQLYLK